MTSENKPKDISVNIDFKEPRLENTLRNEIERNLRKLFDDFEEDRTLVIWFKNGETAIFHYVSSFSACTDNISFNYYGESTEANRHAEFSLENIAGYGIQQ